MTAAWSAIQRADLSAVQKAPLMAALSAVQKAANLAGHWDDPRADWMAGRKVYRKAESSAVLMAVLMADD